MAHVCGLGRTSAVRGEEGEQGESYIFLGADCAHHPGEIRPSRYRPLPREIPGTGGFDPASTLASASLPLPPSNSNSIMDKHRLAPSPLASISPFLVCKDDVTHNVKETGETIAKVQALDAREDVLVVMAHDQSLMDVVRFWPERANGWLREGWKGRGLWGFLGDFVGEGRV